MSYRLSVAENRTLGHYEVKLEDGRTILEAIIDPGREKALTFNARGLVNNGIPAFMVERANPEHDDYHPTYLTSLVMAIVEANRAIYNQRERSAFVDNAVFQDKLLTTYGAAMNEALKVAYTRFKGVVTELTTEQVVHLPYLAAKLTEHGLGNCARPN